MTPRLDALADEDRTRVVVDPLVGAQVAQFYIVARIGSGASGVVYEGWSAARQQVAIKVLKAELALEPDYVSRLMNEARTVAQLRHPSAVHIHTVGVLPDGRPYVVMEHLEGETLESWSRTQGTVGLEDVRRLGAELCSVLSAVHANGIVHRDVKAENIFLVRAGEAGARLKLLDFGIAKVTGGTALTVETHPGGFVGTPSVMSPEQIRGEKVTPQTDLYAVGAVLYRLLTSHDPFEGQGITEVLMQQVSEPPPDPRVRRPDTPAPLAALIASLLAKKPSDRPASASVVEQLLRMPVGTMSAVPLGALHRELPTRSERAPLVADSELSTQVLPVPVPPAPVVPWADDPSPLPLPMIRSELGAAADVSTQVIPVLLPALDVGRSGPEPSVSQLMQVVTKDPSISSVGPSSSAPTAPFAAYVLAPEEPTQKRLERPRPKWPRHWPYVAGAAAVLVGVLVLVFSGPSQPAPAAAAAVDAPASKAPSRSRLTARKVLTRADALRSELRARHPGNKAAGVELRKLRKRAASASDGDDLAAIKAGLDAWEKRFLRK